MALSKIASHSRRRIGAMLLSLAGGVALFGTVPSARADTLADIQKAGVIRIAVPQDYPPFGSVGADMQLKGYDIEVAKLVAAALKVKLQMVPVTMANKIPYLQSSKVDLVLNLGNNAERAKVIDFTQAYAPYYIGIFGPSALPLPAVTALAGKSISVVTSSLEDLLLSKQAPADTAIRRYQDNTAAVSAFLSGQTQFLATGNIVGAALMADHPSAHIEQKLQLMNSPVCAAVRKGDTALREQVDHIFETEKSSGQLKSLALYWLKQPLSPSS